MTEVRRIGAFSCKWGEGALWDERTQRLYFVDVLSKSVHWIDPDAPDLHTLPVPSNPTSLVPHESGGLVAILRDGVYILDVDRKRLELLAPLPADERYHLNDAVADRNGNLITGSVCPREAAGTGSCWCLSPELRWTRLFDGVSNFNGPAISRGGNELFFADTPTATISRMHYDAPAGCVSERTVWADTAPLGGRPDGAALSASGHLWSTIFGAGKLVRFDGAGRVARQIQLPLPHPTSVAFGGRNLDRVYVTSVGIEYKGLAPDTSVAGGLFEIAEAGEVGLIEPRFAKAS